MHGETRPSSDSHLGQYFEQSIETAWRIERFPPSSILPSDVRVNEASQSERARENERDNQVERPARFANLSDLRRGEMRSASLSVSPQILTKN